jgi:hypothetical protein
VAFRENDPVQDPTGYQKLVLGFLGDDDPAAAQAETGGLLAQLIADAGELLRTPPAEGEWSVLQLVSHMLHAELVSSFRYRAIIAGDRPRLAPYDQDRWVDLLPSDDLGPEEQLELFDVLRRANLALWARSSQAERDRIGLHEERGPESFELSFRLIAGHDRLHHEQARATLDQLRG